MAGKAIVLALLALSGLSEALKCYECTGANGVCNGGAPREVECPAPANGCAFTSTGGQTGKACGVKDDAFACVQDKLGQNGDCIKGKLMDVVQYLQECGFDIGSFGGQVDAHSLVYSVFGNATEIRQGETKQDEMFIFCVCGSDLCNTDDLGEGGNPVPTTPGGSGGDNGDSGAIMVSASAVTVSGMLFLIINRLV